MVQSILSGRKTMTRRIVKITKDDITEATWGYTAFTPPGYISFRAKHADGHYGESFVKCPYGQKGDVLWIKETHFRFGHWEEDEGEYTSTGKQKMKFMPVTAEVKYFDNPPENYISYGKVNADHWYQRPSIFMHYTSCRLFTEITGIRVERLQDISRYDAIQEGIERSSDDAEYTWYKNYLWEEGKNSLVTANFKQQPVMSFCSLWAKINEMKSWESNPWVWVVSFKKIDHV